MAKHDNNGHSPDLFVDNDPYEWEKTSITGADIRVLAGLPENVDLFLKVPGHPDQLVEANTAIPLGEPKPHFNTQAVGSKGG